MLWTYVPSIIAVGYGILWLIVDAETKRLEKYRQLPRNGGCTGRGSVCLNYHCFWSPFATIQALRYRQWTVVFSSSAYVLSFIAVPNIQSYVFYWESYSGGTMPWGGQWAWQTFQVNSYWAHVLVGVLTLILFCNISIIVILSLGKTGLDKDPRGIADAVELVLDASVSSYGLDTVGGNETIATVFQKWSDQIFVTSAERKLVMRPRQTHPPPGTGTATNANTHFNLKWQPQRLQFNTSAHSLGNVYASLLALSSSMGKSIVWLKDWVSERSYGAHIQRLRHILWNVFLVLLLSANIYLLARMATPSQMAAQNFALPWSSNIYLLVGVFVQVRLYPLLDYAEY